MYEALIEDSCQKVSMSRFRIVKLWCYEEEHTQNESGLLLIVHCSTYGACIFCIFISWASEDIEA